MGLDRTGHSGLVGLEAGRRAAARTQRFKHGLNALAFGFGISQTVENQAKAWLRQTGVALPLRRRCTVIPSGKAPGDTISTRSEKDVTRSGSTIW